MTRSTVGVVVVAHNTRDDVLACLASIPAELHETTVVVDNASSDATATAVRTRFPSVQVLELANAGFGRGANAGVRVLDTEYAMVANADVRFGEGVFSRLAAELRDRGDVGAVGPMVRSLDGVPQASARRIPTIGQIVGHALVGRISPGNKWSAGYRGDDLDPTASRDAEWLSGCAIMLRRDAFDAEQGFDPGYFLY
ncbi:MAG: glycosyltransferase, partial [Nitriliruptoraceae bacterium]